MRVVFYCLKFAFPLFFALFFSCTTIPTLKVTYKIMPRSNVLEDKEIFFTFVDQRTDKDIIGDTARELYEGYSGNISFILSGQGSEEYLVGIYDVEELFRETFALYLENNGLQLSDEKKPAIPQLIIRLEKFILDLDGRQWFATLSYEAEFIENGRTIVRKFKGEGQKFRISGLNQAHAVVSEVFTDIVNQLDIKSMFAETM
jgi:hypothetical protein